jgi:predicted dehydrogenase
MKGITMRKKLGVGIVGCGNISDTYFRLAPIFRDIEIRAAADINPDLSKLRATQYNVRCCSVQQMLKDSDIDIVLNLTIPAAHYTVSKEAIQAGKHVYSEKPFVLSMEEGFDLKQEAVRAKVRVGSAPDTFLGGAHQYARSIIDAGTVGQITSGTCHVMSHGMESWHPNPDFFFLPGGGPILDLGPYYIANLIHLIGPVKRVAALATIPTKERRITSKPRYGQKIAVRTPTTIQALMHFENGAAITLNASWDVWHHRHGPMELYGETGSIFLPDPNFFGGEVQFTHEGEFVAPDLAWHHPFGVANQSEGSQKFANYRGAGLADLAVSILENRPHRCSLEASLHAIDVTTGMLKSGETGAFVDMVTTCERPSALGPGSAKLLMA